MSATLEQANQAMRQAVKARLDATPADDPKMVGYTSDISDTYAEWTPAFAKPSVAHATLKAAMDAVTDRHAKYGPPSEHFSRTAALVNAAFGTNFTAADWSLVMVLDKVARLRGPTPTTDGGVDICGYGSCYEECRQKP